MRKWMWPACAVAVALAVAPAGGAEQAGKPASAPRVYGPAAPPRLAHRVYGPQPAAAARPPAPQSPKPAAEPVAKVAGRTDSTKAPEKSDDASRGVGKQRTVTIYFVHGEEKQSIVEFALTAPDSKSAITFEASKMEADADGKLLLRGDVRIRFANGVRLGAQGVAVTMRRDEGPVEIVVKE